MNEELEEKEELKDDHKIHFPVAGLIVIGVLILAMIVCIIVIASLGGR